MHKIIALWAHPRSMSTACERIMRERGDLDCAHEPFMYFHYIAQGNGTFPGFDVEEGRPVTYEAIRDHLLERAEQGPVFFKDMAYYVVLRIKRDPAFMARLTHCFLVRDPVASILSYYKLHPDMPCHEIGIAAQWDLFEVLEAAGHRPYVLEADALRAAPEVLMARLWQEIGLDHRAEAFDWNTAPPQDWQHVAAWHQGVSTAAGIKRARPGEREERQRAFDALCVKAPHLRDYLATHQPYYEMLAAKALRV